MRFSFARLGKVLPRLADLVWLLLFLAMVWVSPTRSRAEIGFLLALALVQILEPKVPAASTGPGPQAAAFLKLLLCYLLMGFTGGINSSYYLVLLLPVVSAATTGGWVATLGAILLSCGAYFSFLLFLDEHWVLDAKGFGELGLRIIFLPVVGLLTHQLAETNREQARSAQKTANQLAEANAHLQEAEAAVRRADRLAALGQLTAGLAHEIRNPLGTIRASAEMLRKQLPEDNATASELTGYISSEVDRTNSLITRFLEFARPLHLRRELTDVTAMCERAIAQVEKHHPPVHILIHRSYAPELPPLPVDTELMERVLFNLLLNAAQASPPGATVTVKTRLAGDYGVLSVIDRGSGIAKKNLEDIFNPFFTTKPDGTGLGLAIVSKIVDDHGGRIEVESEPGNGTAFHLQLPLAT